MTEVAKKETLCYHCGNPCTPHPVTVADKAFCCVGCKTVFEILDDKGLCTYYRLNQHPGSAQDTPVWKEKYAFLDKADIKSKLIQFTNGAQTHITFYIPQIHCSSCLYLLERLHTLQKGIVACKVDFTKKEVYLVFEESLLSLRQVVELLVRIGYEPHLQLDSLEKPLAGVNYKTRLYKIGIAGFCFSNIMMLSIPEYLSHAGGEVISPLIAQTFKGIIVGLSLPVFFYAASEFFASAWAGLRSRFINIDVPIALALIVTFGRSLYEVASGIGNGYFDSLSGIVFFMLVGRWLQDKTYQAISFDRDFRSFFPIAVDAWEQDTYVATPIQSLQPNTLIRIHHGELIPADCLLSKGEAAIDYSFVTGESLPIRAAIGEIIYAGGRQTGGVVELVVLKEVSQSYLTNLWNKSKTTTTKLPPSDSFVHVLSKYFSLFVLALGAMAALYWYTQGAYPRMWNALTTVLIVACPCALLLAAAFTNGNILRIFNLNQFYVRHPHVIEALTHIRHIIFDKTGTLTVAHQANVHYEGQPLTTTDYQLLYAVLSQSAHPLSQVIRAWLPKVTGLSVASYKEIPGQGIEAWINEQHIKIGNADFVKVPALAAQQGSQVYFTKDNQLIGSFSVANVYRTGIASLLTDLQQRVAVSVLSGDNDTERTYLAQFIPKENLFFRQKPHEKIDYIRHLQQDKKQNVMMIGDGLNDAAALLQSNIGIAVADARNTFTPAADAVIQGTKLVKLSAFLQVAQQGKRIIVLTFLLSVLYNIVGLYYAVQGTLSPVIAAILMPISSVSIVLITYFATNASAQKAGLQTAAEQ